MNLAFCPNLRVMVSYVADVSVSLVISKDNLKAFCSGPSVALACHPFDDDSCHKSCSKIEGPGAELCNKSANCRARGCPFLRGHFKLICAIATFSVLLHNSFDLRGEGGKFQDPGKLLVWLSKEQCITKLSGCQIKHKFESFEI